MTAQRIVNLGELADLLGMSTPTLRELIKKNPDFPVENRGDHGVAYEFDADQVQAWRAQHQAAIAAAEVAREDELRQMRLELFGDAGDDAAPSGLSPSERRAEIEAQFREDQLRRQRGDLLPVAEVDRLLRLAFVELAKGMRQLGPDLARELGLEREVKVAIEGGIRRRMNDLVDRVQGLLREDPRNRDAA